MRQTKEPMTKQLKKLLKKWPPLYRLAVQIIYTVRFSYFMELLFGTRAREKAWARRHLSKGNDWHNRQHRDSDDEWALGYWDSRSHPHRQFLLEKIAGYAPISSMLEIGCNCGPNLYLATKRFPAARIRGIDINPQAVEIGNKFFSSEGLANVSLSLGKADELGQFPDKSFDIILTDAVLMYIGRDKIRQTIQEMVRVARRALILVEWHCFEPQHRDPHGLGVRCWGCWRRDYKALLKEFIPEERIHISKITEDVWPDERWQEMGAVIEAVVEQSNRSLASF